MKCAMKNLTGSTRTLHAIAVPMSNRPELPTNGYPVEQLGIRQGPASLETRVSSRGVNFSRSLVKIPGLLLTVIE
jgi:hypothetical protein